MDLDFFFASPTYLRGLLLGKSRMKENHEHNTEPLE